MAAGAPTSLTLHEQNCALRSGAQATKCQLFAFPWGNPREAKPSPKTRLQPAWSGPAVGKHGSRGRNLSHLGRLSASSPAGCPSSLIVRLSTKWTRVSAGGHYTGFDLHPRGQMSFAFSLDPNLRRDLSWPQSCLLPVGSCIAFITTRSRLWLQDFVTRWA